MHILVTRSFSCFILLAFFCIYPAEVQLQEVSTIDKSFSPPDPQDSVKSGMLASGPDTPSNSFHCEVAAFTLRGKQSRQNLTIPDLEIMVTEDEKRYFPLFRLLTALNLEKSEEGPFIIFQPEGSPPIVIDLQKKTIGEKNAGQPVNFIDAVSDISQERDIFLPPEVISQLFFMDLKWNDMEYAFNAATEKSLTIWKREEGTSLLSIKTTEILAKLPEAHPPASPMPSKFSLDFMELKAQARYRVIDPNISEELNINSLEQTFWGSLMDGRYKVRIREPSLNWNSDGTEFNDDPPIMLDWAQWRYRSEATEIVAGDSVFGLNHLVFPTLKMTGIRFNGIWGLDEKTLSDRSGFGKRNIFVPPQTYSGSAPVGSTVELILNDRVIETTKVLTSLPTRPGTGMYRFEEISLAPGSLNDLIIRITEPNGEITVIEKSILGSSTLLPQGNMAFLSGLGTNRDTVEWESRGTYLGGRVLYGLNDRLTLGSTLAYQKNFFKPATLFTSNSYERPYPDSSLHTGAQFSWQPLAHSILSGYASWVQGEEGYGQGSFSDFAYSLEYELFPWQTANLNMLYFWYGPDFFNGSNRNLRDRKGYVINPEWRIHPKWRLESAFGEVKSNVNGDQTETLSANFQNMTLSSSIIPQTTVIFSYDRLAPKWDEATKNLVSIGFRSRPFSGFSFSGTYATGDDLSLDDNRQFFQGLSLPGISLHGSHSTSAGISKRLPVGGSVSLNYSKTDTREKVLLGHTNIFDFKIPVEVRTELGYQYDTDSYSFRNFTEIPLNASGKSRLGIRTQLDQEEWRVELSLTFNEIFSFLGRSPRRITDRRRINPENGIVFGRVYLDRNANAIFDEGEQGLDGIPVFLNNRSRIKTNEKGRFIYSVSGKSKELQLNLKPDDIPAIYSCTHGQQKVRCREGEITEVNFGLTPLNIVQGYVGKIGKENEPNYIPGIKVKITSASGKNFKADSVTASDGSYYLEDIRPGKYTIQLAPETIPPGLKFEERIRTIQIEPSEDPQEIKVPDFMASLESEESPTALIPLSKKEKEISSSDEKKPKDVIKPDIPVVIDEKKLDQKKTKPTAAIKMDQNRLSERSSSTSGEKAKNNEPIHGNKTTVTKSQDPSLVIEKKKHRGNKTVTLPLGIDEKKVEQEQAKPTAAIKTIQKWLSAWSESTNEKTARNHRTTHGKKTTVNHSLDRLWAIEDQKPKDDKALNIPLVINEKKVGQKKARRAAAIGMVQKCLSTWSSRKMDAYTAVYTPALHSDGLAEEQLYPIKKIR